MTTSDARSDARSDAMGREINVQEASLQTAIINIRTLQVNNKQMTLAVFRQLPEETILAPDGEILGDVWGWVNHHVGCNAAVGDATGDLDHWHYIWQKGAALRKGTALCNAELLADRWTYARSYREQIACGVMKLIYEHCVNGLCGTTFLARPVGVGRNPNNLRVRVQYGSEHVALDCTTELPRYALPFADFDEEAIRAYLESYNVYDVYHLDADEEARTIVRDLDTVYELFDTPAERVITAIRDAGQLFIAV